MTPKRKPKIGLALGSGGARGWCHIGVLRALEEIGVKPDVVAGASMGALVGAIYTGEGLDALEEWALKQTASSFFRMLDINLSSGGLVDGAEIVEVVNRLIKHRRFEDQKTPLAVVATDMATGREVWMTKGEVAKAVRASVALPGVISPYQIEDQWFLDGGLTNPLPVSACHILGADVVIAVNPNGNLNDPYWPIPVSNDAPTDLMVDWRKYLPKWPTDLSSLFEGDDKSGPKPSYLEVIATSIDIMTDGIRRSKLAGHPPHVLMDARLAHISVLDFHRAKETIEEGRRIVHEHAQGIQDVAGL